jgi:hypothetical protein
MLHICAYNPTCAAVRMYHVIVQKRAHSQIIGALSGHACGYRGKNACDFRLAAENELPNNQSPSGGFWARVRREDALSLEVLIESVI